MTTRQALISRTALRLVDTLGIRYYEDATIHAALVVEGWTPKNSSTSAYRRLIGDVRRAAGTLGLDRIVAANAARV